MKAEIAVNDLLDKVFHDYEHNFMPRKGIELRLTYKELVESLQNDELQKQIRIIWCFKFYVKQLFWLSWNRINQDKKLTEDEKLKMFNNLDKIVTFANFNETRALVTHIRISFFLEQTSSYDLYQIFSGTSICDDECAQNAYFAYKCRRADEIKV